jgi:hypothetical protein
VKQIRKRLTYANVMSSIAVFLVLGGGAAYAAKKIGSNEIKGNSITTGKIKKEAVTRAKIKKAAIDPSKLADNAVTTSKIADDAVTGDKVKESTLGTVPSATNATTASNLTPPEAYHEIGTTGQPPFENGAVNFGGEFSTAAFFKDHEGVVHLKGTVTATGGTVIFTLPAGYRPSQKLDIDAIGSGAQAYIYIKPDGTVEVNNGGAGTTYGLDSITFRAS